MTATLQPPVPKDLREQMVKRVSTMPEPDLVELYQLALLREKLRLREEISHQADRENADGVWDDLPEFIQAWRLRMLPGK
jgi:hypothetical protein